MKILFITAHPYLPQLYGGLQTSTDQLCQSLIKRGHSIIVLSGMTADSRFGKWARTRLRLNKIFKNIKICRDTVMGYRVWRTWFAQDLVDYVARREKPDLIVVLAGDPARMAVASRALGIPMIMLLQNVEFKDHGGDFSALTDIPCIANSQFTAEKYRNAYGIQSTVIYPYISLEKYKTETTRENVTFINPHLLKGRDIATAIARQCPNIPFTFVEGWPLSDEQRQELMQQLADLPNVTLLPAQKDMRKIYGRARILLVPSQWEEAYGMVVTEAQSNGIPVIASRRGGLPEAVGDGGILIDPAQPVDDWVTALRALWTDKNHYKKLSAQATNYAQRPEMNFDYQISQYERAFEAAISALDKR